MVYEPREDSFLLQKFVKIHARGKVLDVGTGSGIQALTAVENTKDVTAVDSDPEAVAVTRAKGIHAFESDLFSAVQGTFDCIIFNPPYLPKEEGYDELAITGGKYGYEILERFFKEAKQFLNKDGKMLIVFSTITGDIEFLLRQHGYVFEKLGEESFFFEKVFVYLIKRSE